MDKIDLGLGLDLDLDLDFDWLVNQKKLSDPIDEKYVKEKMTSIAMHYIYIDSKNSIIKVINEREQLLSQGDYSILPGNKSMELIQYHNLFENKKYKFSEILLYNVQLDSNNIQAYNNDNKSVNFLTTLPYFDVIKVLPSLFVFHPINCIYLIFKEMSKKNETKKNTSRKKNKRTYKIQCKV